MRSLTVTLCVAAIISSMLVAGAAAQSGPKSQKGDVSKKSAQGEAKPKTASDESKPDDQQDKDAVKLGTTLVTVPVIVSDRNDIYIPDLKKEDFTLYEDGVKQEIVFFATTKEPFHVVLMIDTSASTQDQIGEIQRAAFAFVEQLQPADRVKVISFDDEVRDLINFTSDRAELRRAIASTRPGKGTRMYDAMRRGLGALNAIEGRKAIVLFSDGMDYHSTDTNYADNITMLEESGIIIYPIRYETRAETEAMYRRQQDQGGIADPGVILGGPTTGGRPPIGTTPPTTPGGDNPVPRTDGRRDPLEIPNPPVILNPPRTDRYPGGGRFPDDPSGGNRYPNPRIPDNRRRQPDSTTVMFDGLYRIADQYLEELAMKSGGKLHRADTLVSLPAAFAKIAAELRTQYSLGYYPANTARDDSYRKIQVRLNRKDAVIRARPGYRVSTGV